MSRCFVLGAGFSKPCGCPLASELTKLVFRHAFPPNDSFRPDVRAHWLRFLHHLYPEYDLEGNWPDFEDLITVLDEWSLYQQEYEGRTRAGEPLSPSHFKRVLLQHMARLLCDAATSAPTQAFEQVKDFVSSLRGGTDTLICFNWDPLIEMACHELGLDLRYDDDRRDVIHMAKPHGSVTLAEMTSAEFAQRSQAINVCGVHIDWTHGETIVVRAEDPADAAARIVAPFEETVIVEPTARKVYRSPWIKRQWCVAYDMLHRADQIFVIGFSMPPTDYRPRVLFQAAAMDRERSSELHIIAPNARELERHYRAVVGGPITPVQASWIDWMNERVGG